MICLEAAIIDESLMEFLLSLGNVIHKEGDVYSCLYEIVLLVSGFFRSFGTLGF